MLVQRALVPEKIDRGQAEALRLEADGKLKKGAAGADQRAAQADLEWAEAQLSL